LVRLDTTKEQKMAITKQTVVDQITVTENGIVLYREATSVVEDGNTIAKTYHRTSPDTGARPHRPTSQCGGNCSSRMDTRGHRGVSASTG
jgi:hypothetical protein